MWDNIDCLAAEIIYEYAVILCSAADSFEAHSWGININRTRSQCETNKKCYSRSADQTVFMEGIARHVLVQDPSSE